MENNFSIKNLDLSWNSIGQDKITNSIFFISESLAINETLKHLDLSNNKLSYNDCKILAESLKKNHKIQGLHFEGNYGKVDGLGFINPMSYSLTLKVSKQSNRIISKTKENSCENC